LNGSARGHTKKGGKGRHALEKVGCGGKREARGGEKRRGTGGKKKRPFIKFEAKWGGGNEKSGKKGKEKHSALAARGGVILRLTVGKRTAILSSTKKNRGGGEKKKGKGNLDLTKKKKNRSLPYGNP